MCQTLKKLFVICVSIVLVVSCFTSVSASGLSNDTYSKIRNALCAAEGIKAEMGLSHVDFEAFTVGKPIYVYDFKGNTLVKSGEYYPLFIDNVLTAFAIQITLKNITTYQFSTAYVNDILQLGIGNNTAYAFIFDCRATYLYYNGNATQIKISGSNYSERGDLRNCESSTFSGIHLQNMNSSTSLKYISQNSNARSLNTYIRCEVDFVPQNEYNICWAGAVNKQPKKTEDSRSGILR